ncbi:hypothetical protein KR009_009444 [Drosophila setifemur]|nr:hypothetical protein KR009_009444 [Drosophila setifemur]
MSLDYRSWLLDQVARFYHSVYFYASLFSLIFCFLVHHTRERIYYMELTWSRVSMVYTCAGCLVLVLTLAGYYFWVSLGGIWRQYCAHKKATQRASMLFDLYRLQQLGALK